MTLEEAIDYCEGVAEENEDFKIATSDCQYCQRGWEDGWVYTCRHPSNIPEGCSWGKCDPNLCPIFDKCLKCASEYRQFAEWLRTLKDVKTAIKYGNKSLDQEGCDHEMAFDIYSMVYNHIETLVEEVNVDADSY